MNSLPIPETDQINAILTDSVYELVCKYVDNPSPYNLKQYLTIDRKKITDFLTQHPDKAAIYFKKHASTEPTHDIEQIWKENSNYVVASMDHGKPHFVRRFHSLSKATAEHMLVTYGMY